LSQKDYYRVLSLFASMKVDAEVAIGTPAEFETIRKENERIDDSLLPIYREWSGLVLPLLAKLEQTQGDKKPRMTPKQAEESIRAIKKGLEPADPKAKTDVKPYVEALRREMQRVEDGLRDVATPEQLQTLKECRAQAKKLDDARPAPQKAPVYAEAYTKGAKASTNLLIRGEVGKRGPEVPFGLPEALEPSDYPPPIPTEKSSGRRLWFARWITGPARELAARVMVNRIWHYHFGQGFLPDGNNLGLQAGSPTHPELLEWLAQDFVRGGWSIKRMHRQIVLSATYRQGVASPHEKADPENKFMTRWPLHRLESEAIRDSILAVSGKLNRTLHGPSVFPPLESKVVGDSTSDDWKVSLGDEAYRRSVYVFSKRAIPLPELGLLGMPDPSVSTAQRQVSTTPVQSLLLLNSKFADQQARFFADRVRRDAGTDAVAQVKHAFSLALCRPPREQELAAALAFLDMPMSADAPPPATKTGPALAPLDRLAAFCLVLFNTNEFVYSN
ncbi:MAG: DUF1553 domain-containing protein, partial [Planctomycetota bacterium]